MEVRLTAALTEAVQMSSPFTGEHHTFPAGTLVEVREQDDNMFRAWARVAESFYCAWVFAGQVDPNVEIVDASTAADVSNNVMRWGFR